MVNLWGELVGAVAWDPDRELATFEFDREFLKRDLDLAPLQMPLAAARRGDARFSFRQLGFRFLSSFLTFLNFPIFPMFHTFPSFPTFPTFPTFPHFLTFPTFPSFPPFSPSNYRRESTADSSFHPSASPPSFPPFFPSPSLHFQFLVKLTFWAQLQVVF